MPTQTLNLNDEQYQIIRERAETEDKSKSAIARELIDKGIEAEQ